ncbi:Macrolide export ATP-binding/permease protein MacB [Streptococcus cristatus]|uniref:Macrolide export ATP-binding/permease protein MacB n=1 Tax=Streptococcus cristatus TaxID=45634 RepID=A0A3R9KPI2_STRCR|nr:ABC transporter ATP-binding protein [Streptococcus cristatus]RSJ79783.1 Macrolide export ATP-binding/permease protein MacB [Streptococcus cristatus]RSJ81073.1 Macrolide export ATP-binding/permease protein MacB [Streptococcus cristatus]RSJ87349.1 Macrolide export ATP-binding/permease protein MacB [Streptococcus cristatus]RSJ87815.1 Macrolide export ATP-binding/permease protein MacB [Streptococcus cristatus]
MIRLKGIRKSYNGREVLKGIDLEIVDQDYLVILGASGSGKSTLLNVLSGLEKPDSGHVYYGEEDLSQLTEAQLTAFRRAKIAFIFQQYFLLPNLTVEQNVKMGANLAGNHDYVRILEALGLGDKLQHYPSQLSGGEQQRVAIARALAKRPRVLFLDEPTGALDEATGRQILAYISSLQEELGFTLVMVTHNANIAQMAKTIVHINSGQIQSLETNSQPKTAYEIGW